MLILVTQTYCLTKEMKGYPPEGDSQTYKLKLHDSAMKGYFMLVGVILMLMYRILPLKGFLCVLWIFQDV